MKKFLIMSLLFGGQAFAHTQQLATPATNQIDGDSTLPNLNNKNKGAGDQIFPNLTDKELEDIVRKNIEQSQQLLTAQNGVPTPQATQPNQMPTPVPAPNNAAPAANVPANNVNNTSIQTQGQNQNVAQFNPPPPFVENKGQGALQQPPAPSYFTMPNGVRIFSSNIKAKQIAEQTVELPATSVALGHLMEGIEVGIINDTQRIGLTLDFAFLGPNGGYVQMKGCNLFVDVYAKYSFSRLRGNLVSMTCRAPNGSTFTIPIQGHIVSATDKMEYKGLDGTLIMPGKTAAGILTFLQSAITAFGQAAAAAQVQTSATTGQVGAPTQSSNVIGDQNKYIFGQTAAGAVGNFMNWIVDFYKSMEVGLAVEPGRKTFVMLEQTILVPKMFFGEEIPKNFVSFINDGVKTFGKTERMQSNENYNTATSTKAISDEKQVKDNKS